MNKLNSSNRLHAFDKPIVAITGGIATGKSTVSEMLRKLGHFVIDADQLVKKIYAANDSIVFIKKLVPEAINNEQIDFKLLRKKFFDDPNLQSQIEQFIYSKLPQAFLDEASKMSSQFVFYDVPLLFDKKLDSKVDAHICVHVPTELQLTRLIERDKISKEDALKILAKQMPIDEKARLSHFVINNSGSKEESLKQVQQIISKLNF